MFTFALVPIVKPVDVNAVMAPVKSALVAPRSLVASPCIVDVRMTIVCDPPLTMTTSGWKPTVTLWAAGLAVVVYEPVATFARATPLRTSTLAATRPATM